jgi:YgiT-type zinc finger domain-containing protein
VGIEKTRQFAGFEIHYCLYADSAEVDRFKDARRKIMNTYADCTYCGGEVTEKKIDYDYRRQTRLIVFSNVPAGVCRQCGEKYFKPDALKQMDEIYHDIFDRKKKPQRTLTVPAVSL